MRRLALRVLPALAAAAVVAWLGAWWWRWHLPRPDLLSFVPAGAELIVQIRDGDRVYARLRSLDPSGRLVGTQGVLDAALRSAIGPSPTLAQIAEFSRDEALAAVLPNGGFLAVCRLGVRERLADRLFAGVRLVHTRAVPGGTIRVIRWPRGGRLAWTITSGVIVLARDEAEVSRALTARGGPATPQAAGMAAALPARYSIRVLRLPPHPVGPLVAAGIELELTRAGISAHARVVAAPMWHPPTWLGEMTAAEPSSGAEALAGFPATSLAAVTTADGRWLRHALQAMLKGQEGPLRTLLAVLLEPGGRGAAGRLRPAVALLGIDHRGVLPMPQLAAVLGEGAASFPEATLVRTAAEVRRISHGELRLDRTAVRGLRAWAVNFPVTRTLAPSFVCDGRDAVAGSSLAALETVLGARAGDVASLAGFPVRVWEAPAHMAAYADLAGLAAETEAIVGGLREYGMLAPAAERRYRESVAPWLAAAGAAGRAGLAARMEGGWFSLDAEFLPR